MKKIAIMGPESTGKSSITHFLADHYQCLWVPEFAREYCNQINGTATLKDELQILEGQIALEQEYLKKGGHLLFCDTMFLTVKIYSEHVFKTYPKELDLYLKNTLYDYFLIMDIDLPWEDDPLREFPGLRAYFLEIHIQEIKSLKVPYTLISGIGQVRIHNALRAVEAFFKKNS